MRVVVVLLLLVVLVTGVEPSQLLAWSLTKKDLSSKIFGPKKFWFQIIIIF